MANKSRRRSRKGFVAILVDATITIGAVGSKAVAIADLMGGNLTEDFYAISTDLQAQVLGLTAGEGDPSMCILAHGDYTVAEIAEALVVKLLGPGSKIEQERTRRLVRKVGPFYGDGTATQTTSNLEGRQGPGLVRTALKFIINSGKTLSVGFYNNSGATMTTGATVRVTGTVYGRWII